MIGVKKLIKGIFLSLLLTLVAACETSVDINENMARAKQYLESNDLNAAALELKNILREDAKHAESRFLLGKISLRLGDSKTAQKELRRAMDAGWDEASVNILLAEALFRQGNFQALRDEIPIKDDYSSKAKAELLGFWAMAEAGLGKWEDAEETVNSGLAFDEKALWLMQSNIRLQLHRGDMQAATDSVSSALEVHPDSQDLWMIKAGLAEKEDDLSAANAALQKVVDLDPLRSITFLGRLARLSQSQLWIRQEDFDKAKTVVEPILKSYPTDPLANYTIALIAFREAEYETTEEHLSTALRVMPEHRPSLLLFGALNYARNDYQQAAYYLEKAAASQPDDIGAQTLLGKAYLKLGQYSEAEDRLTFASSKTEENAKLLALIGITRMRSGNTQSGIQELERAAASSPTDVVIRSELARAYMTAGDTERAIGELESTLATNQNQHQTEALLLLAYLKAGEFDKALELAATLTEQFPKNPLPYNLAGVAYEGKQDFSSARNKYDTALGIEPDDVMAMLNLARLDLNAGKVDAARKRYHSVLDKQPKNAAAMVALAKIFTREEKIEEALELLEKARQADEHALNPRLILSKYYLGKGMAEEALVYANEALKIAPQNSLAVLFVGRAQMGAGKSVAVQTLEGLAESLPEMPNVHYYLAEAQARFGDITAMRQSLKRALELMPDHVPALLAMGKLELSKGKNDAALKISQQLKKILPEETAGYILEGDVLMAKAATQDALKVYQKALAHAKNGEAAIRISKAQRVLGDATASYEVLQGWLEKHSEDAAVRFMLALLYLTDGEKDLAVQQYERILETQPDDSAVLNDLAWLYYERGKPEAVKMAEKAYRLAPDNPAIQDTYGWILVRTGKVESGLLALEQAATNAPLSPDIRYHLAAALAKAGEKERAKQELKVALDSDKPFVERAAAEAFQKQLQ